MSTLQYDGSKPECSLDECTTYDLPELTVERLEPPVPRDESTTSEPFSRTLAALMLLGQARPSLLHKKCMNRRHNTLLLGHRTLTKPSLPKR